MDDPDLKSSGKKYGPRRFYVKDGTSRRCVFLDEEGFNLWEHQLRIGDSWTNWFTCLGRTCPICDMNYEPYRVSMFTVGDLSEWTDRNGKKREFGKQLFPAKGPTVELLKKLATKRGGLKGCIFEAIRSGSKAPNVGSQFDFEEKVDDLLATFKPKLSFLTDITPVDYLRPYDYEKLLAPMERSELIRVLRRLERSTAGDFPTDTGSPTGADDDVPFAWLMPLMQFGAALGTCLLA
jgi:hypothetical protein